MNVKQSKPGKSALKSKATRRSILTIKISMIPTGREIIVGRMGALPSVEGQRRRSAPGRDVTIQLIGGVARFVVLVIAVSHSYTEPLRGNSDRITEKMPTRMAASANLRETPCERQLTTTATKRRIARCGFQDIMKIPGTI